MDSIFDDMLDMLNTPPVDNGMVFESLLKIGFLTGSMAFGTNRADSDYDIVYSVDDSSKVAELIKGFEKTNSDYFAGYFINIGDKQINLIPVHPHEYLPWYLATKAMTATLKQSGIQDPIRKYSVFMGIVSLFKGTVEQRSNLEAYNEVKKLIAEGF